MLIEPFKVKTPSWRLIKARLVLLEGLMQDPGYNSSGLTVRNTMEVGCTENNSLENFFPFPVISVHNMFLPHFHVAVFGAVPEP